VGLQVPVLETQVSRLQQHPDCACILWLPAVWHVNNRCFGRPVSSPFNGILSAYAGCLPCRSTSRR
jgi:hypothetical protein